MYICTYCNWFDLLCILQRNILSLSVYVCAYVRAYVCVLQMLLMSLISCQSSRQDSCSPSVLRFPPHPHTIASVACSLLKKPWTESGSTQQQKEAIATMLKCVGLGAVGGGGRGRGREGRTVIQYSHDTERCVVHHCIILQASTLNYFLWHLGHAR